MQKKKKSQSYVIELSHSHTAIKDPYDWKWETAAFLDGLLQIGGGTHLIYSFQDYQDSFTSSWLLYLKAFPAFLGWCQRDLHMGSRPYFLTMYNQ